MRSRLSLSGIRAAVGSLLRLRGAGLHVVTRARETVRGADCPRRVVEEDRAGPMKRHRKGFISSPLFCKGIGSSLPKIGHQAR